MLREAVILAGGLGTRLRPLVSDVPKPLAPIDGRPFLHWLLEGIGKRGVKRVILATGYMASKIEDNLGHNYNGIDIAYSYEEQPLGTGGALWQALSLCHTERVFALNGDTWLNANMNDMSKNHAGADMILAVIRLKDQSRFGGVVLDDDRLIGLNNNNILKTNVFINAGLYILNRNLPLKFRMESAFSLEKDIFAYPKNIDIRVYKTDVQFLDIGTPEDYILAQKFIPEWSIKSEKL